MKEFKFSVAPACYVKILHKWQVHNLFKHIKRNPGSMKIHDSAYITAKPQIPCSWYISLHFDIKVSTWGSVNYLAFFPTQMWIYTVLNNTMSLKNIHMGTEWLQNEGWVQHISQQFLCEIFSVWHQILWKMWNVAAFNKCCLMYISWEFRNKMFSECC